MDTTLRILFVEDNEHDRIAFKRAFKDSRITCAITEYEKAEDALERLESDESSFDIIVSDHGLPGMSGLEFCKELLARKTSLPLVILTGTGTEQIALDALKSGVYDYIIKDAYDGYLKILPVTIAGVVKKHNEKQLRIKAEEQNKEWNNRYEAAVKASGHVLYDWDSETNKVVYGGDLEGVLGYTTEEMEGGISRWIELIHPDNHDYFKKTVEHLLATKNPAHLEYRVRRKDGNYIFVEDRGQFFADAKGNISRMVGFISDITERKQAQERIIELNESLERRVIERTEELRKSEMKYSILAQTSPVGMWHSDANGDCLYINERCSEIIGLSVEDALQDGWAQNLHPDDRDRVFKEWHDTAKNMQVFKSEYRFTLPNGKTTWVYGQAIPETDKNGIVIGYVGTITDITERKEFEDQISSSLKEKEVLIKEIHHRVKNNMQLVTSLLRLQSERIKDKHLHDIFLESQNRIKSMALIHEQLYTTKDFTSIEFYHITRSLIDVIMRSYEIGPGRITVNMIGNEVLLDINKAIPCGLIINELVSNTLKHAFPEDKKGELKVSMHRIADFGMQNADFKSEIRNV